MGETIKKRGIAGILQALVLLLLVIFGLSVIFLNMHIFFEKDSNPAEKLICSINAFMNAYAREPILRNEVYKYECKPNRIMVAIDQLKKKDQPPKEVIEKSEYWQNYNFDDEVSREKYNLNKVVAKEMRDCWDKGGSGHLPIGEKWWWPIRFKDFKEVENEKGFWAAWDDMFRDKLPHFRPTPVLCIICSKIEFDNEVKNLYPSGTGIDLIKFLENTKHPVFGMSLYQFLLNPNYEPSLLSPQYDYSTDRPIAVVYARINAHRLTDYTQGVGKLINKNPFIKLFDEKNFFKPVDAIMLIPYDELYFEPNLNQGTCTEVMNLG